MRARHWWLWTFVSFLALLPTAAFSQDRPPNIVLILADDLGYGDLSTYGGWIETPHLDRMAREGLRFTDFHASGPVCSPTRAGLLTGRYQQRAGIPGVVYAPPEMNRHHGLHPQEVTFAELLRKAGYATAVFGKWHLGYEEQYNPIHHGFDRFRGYVSGNVDYFAKVDGVGYYDWWEGDELVNEHGYVTHLITEHALDFIEEHQDQPFALYLPHEAPHFPFQGPDDEPFRLIGARVKEDRDSVRVRRAYREMVEELDRSVGAVLETLERLGLAENTFVFFFSDNGALEFGSNGPLRGYKGSLWEGGIRVPALAWWPGRIAAGAATGELAISLDLMPTMLALAGASAPEEHHLDGADLLPVLLEGETLAERTLFWSYEGQEAARQGPWKLVRNVNGQEGLALYNLAEDLDETDNVAEAHPQRVQDLLEALERWQDEVARGATRQPEKESSTTR